MERDMKRILVVDDDDALRNLLCKVLARAGYEAIPAEDGKAALAQFKESGADLVLTDLIMPEMEGLESITELRRLEPDVKIIAMSGGGRKGPDCYLPLAKMMGAAKTLEKPFLNKDLLAAVEEVLGETPS